MRDGAAAGPDGADVDRGGADLQVADRGLPADAGGEVLHQRDVGRRAAHVEGEEVAEPGLLGRPRGTRHAARGAGEQQVDGVVGGRARRGQAAVAAEDRERAVDARVPQLAARGWRRSARPAAARTALATVVMVRSYSRSSGRTAEDSDTGSPGSSSAAISRDPLLVGGVGVGVDEADAQGLDAAAGQARAAGADVVLVELGDDRAVAGDAPPDLDGVLQGGERLGLGPDDPARQPAGDERPGDLQHLAEARGWSRGRPGRPCPRGWRWSPPWCRAAPRRPDVARCRRRRRSPLDAAQHPDGLVLGGRGGLGPPRRAGVLVDQQDVGEGSTDVHAEPVGHALRSCGSDDAGGAERGQLVVVEAEQAAVDSSLCSPSSGPSGGPRRGSRTASGPRSAWRTRRSRGGRAGRSPRGPRSAGRRTCPWRGRCGRRGRRRACRRSSRSSASTVVSTRRSGRRAPPCARRARCAWRTARRWPGRAGPSRRRGGGRPCPGWRR